MLVKLKDLIIIKNGRDYKHLYSGDIPVIGTGGIMTYVDKSLYNGEAILLPRKGSLNNVMYMNSPFWTVDTMFYALPKSNINCKFLFYNLSLLDITKLDVGSTIPSMTSSLYYDIKIDMPDINRQNMVASLLTKIDNQIEQNNAMVKKLQVLAQSTFHYFFSNCSLKKELLSTFIVENKKSVLQVNEVEDTRGMIPFFTSGDTIKYVDESLVDGFNLYLSTGGNANIKFYYGKASYSTDTWCITANNNLKFYLYEYLKMIESQMDSLYFHGTGLKHLQKPLFLNSEIPVPRQTLSKYNAIVEPIFKKISNIKMSTIKITNLKNKLLPLLINQQLY